VNLTEYLLATFAEEAAEVGKETLKCIRFGVDQHYEHYDATNLQRLILEFSDLEATRRDLQLVGIDIRIDEHRVSEKRARNVHFANVSKETGTLE